MLKGAKRDLNGIVDGFIEIQHRGYPMLQQGNGAISGEVYWVPEPCWHALDDWEDVPEVYQRSSTMTLKMGIERKMRESIPEVSEVVQVL